VSRSIFLIHTEGGERAWSDYDAERSEAEERCGPGESVVEYVPADPWVLVSERLPEESTELEFVARKRPVRRFGAFAEGVGFFDGRVNVPTEEVLCWRPARSVGELPGGER
jgi:hypothetical protein